jgi:hypothetical protein
MQKGTEFIKNTHPDATDFSYVGTKDFLEGKISRIRFKYDQKEIGVNFIYDHDGKWEFFRNGDQLVDNLGAIKKPPGFLTMLLRTDHVAGVIAIVLLTVITVLVFREKPLPDILSNTFALVVGFYFGSGRQRSTALPTFDSMPPSHPCVDFSRSDGHATTTGFQ